MEEFLEGLKTFDEGDFDPSELLTEHVQWYQEYGVEHPNKGRFWITDGQTSILSDGAIRAGWRIGRHEAFAPESQSNGGKKGGATTQKNKKGIFCPDYDRTPNAIKAGRISGKKAKEFGTGIFSMTKEEKAKASRKGSAATRAQRWRCKVTGYISSPCGLSNYQKGKGIDFRDKSLRERLH